jgi:predicted dehydrogenase
MKFPLKVGIAGFGVVGKRRRQCIDQHSKLKTVAVCDQKFQQPGIMSDGVYYYPDYRQLLKHPLDILFVSLPNYLAADVTIAALEQGLHVFCEKPPGRDVSDIERVIEIEKKRHGQLLKYGFNHRYHDSVCEALRIIKSGELGEIVNLRGIYGKSAIHPIAGGWRAERKYSGGGILLDQGIHMIDLMQLFCGDFIEVKSFVSNSHWNHDVEDNTYALMRDKQGRVAMLHSSTTQWEHRFLLDIALTEGCLELKGILTSSKSYGQEKLVIIRRSESDVGTQRDETMTYLEDNSWKNEIFEFADAVINSGTIMNGSSADALTTMKLVYRIYYADPEWRETYHITNPDEPKTT